MQAGASFQRFYLPLLYAIVGTIVSIILVDEQTLSPVFIRLLFTCALGISVSIGSLLFAERSVNRSLQWVMPMGAVIFTFLYGFFLAPDTLAKDYCPWLIFMVLSLVMHFWVAIAAYLTHDEQVGFWRFNEILYSRIILAGLFSVALFLGLSTALGACNILFRVHIDAKVYLYLWILIAGIFNTWFFLAGVPADFEELNSQRPFPKALKVFTQYILMPIVVLYMLILYVYTSKIITEFNLPKGYVSILILWYSVFGILAILLVNPLRDDREAAWVRLFSRFFFIASLPLIVLLYVAIGSRVGKYGITEPRYYLMVMAGWLTFIAFYFIFSREKNIRIVPVSLALVGLLSLFGPWGVFSVAEHSQLHRLEAILQRNQIWKPGQKVTQATVNLENNDRREVMDVLRYFVERRSITPLKEVFAKDLTPMEARLQNTYKPYQYYNYNDNMDVAGQLMEMLTAPPSQSQQQMSTQWAAEVARRNAHQDMLFSSDLKQGLDVRGYSKVCVFSPGYGHFVNYIYPSASDSLNVAVEEKDTMAWVVISRNKQKVATIDMNPMLHLLKQKQEIHRDHQWADIPVREMTIESAGDHRFKMIIKSMVVKDIDPMETNNQRNIKHIDAWILVR